MSERFSDTLPLPAVGENSEFDSFAYAERLYGPFMLFMGRDIQRAEALYEAEYGVKPFNPADLPEVGTPERAELEATANAITDSMFLSELSYIESGRARIRQAVTEHPDKDIVLASDVDGSLTPLVSPEDIGRAVPEHVTIRLGLPALVETEQRELGMSATRRSPGERTLSVAVCSTRPGDNIMRIADDIDAACDFAGGPVVDRELSVSSHQKPSDFERNLTYEQAQMILSVLDPELPGLEVEDQESVTDPEVRASLRELVQFLVVCNELDAGMKSDEDKAQIVKGTAAFLQSLDGWSRGKVPAIAKLIHDNPDKVFVYFDDAAAPGLLKHDRLYPVHLQGKCELGPEAVGSRFLAVDDPRLLVDNPKLGDSARPRKVLAVLGLRYKKFVEAFAASTNS